MTLVSLASTIHVCFSPLPSTKAQDTYSIFSCFSCSDSSKSYDDVRFVAVFPDSVVQGHLLESASIFTVELSAVLIVVIHIAYLSTLMFVVVSDSFIAIQTIGIFDSPLPQVCRIQLWLRCISSKNRHRFFFFAESQDVLMFGATSRLILVQG